MDCIVNTVTNVVTGMRYRFLHWLNTSVNRDLKEIEQEKQFMIDLTPEERLVLRSTELENATQVIQKLSVKANLSSVNRTQLAAARVLVKDKQVALTSELIATLSLNRTKETLVNQALLFKRVHVQSTLQKTMRPIGANHLDSLDLLKRVQLEGRTMEDMVAEELKEMHDEYKEELEEMVASEDDISEDEADNIANDALYQRAVQVLPEIGIIDQENPSVGIID